MLVTMPVPAWALGTGPFVRGLPVVEARVAQEGKSCAKGAKR